MVIDCAPTDHKVISNERLPLPARQFLGDLFFSSCQFAHKVCIHGTQQLKRYYLNDSVLSVSKFIDVGRFERIVFSNDFSSSTIPRNMSTRSE